MLFNIFFDIFIREEYHNFILVFCCKNLFKTNIDMEQIISYFERRNAILSLDMKLKSMIMLKQTNRVSVYFLQFISGFYRSV